MRTPSLVLMSSLALALTAAGARAAPCKDDHPGLAVSPPGGQEAQVLVRLSRAPDARATVTLVEDGGATVTVTFAPATDDAVARTVTVPAGTYYLAYAGAAVTLPPERADGAPRRRFQRACWASATQAKIALAEADAAVDDGDASVTLTVTVRSVATGRAAAIDLSDPVAAADLRGFGLTDAAPAAVTETLRLIAEIAMDKAKAEALRRFRQQVVKRVCTELSVKAVFGGDDEQPLLPATCGQLDNLRLGDLGGSARGLVDALRADLAGVVLTKLLDEVVKGASLDGRITAAIRTLVSRAATGELTGAEVRAALVAAVHDLASTAGAEAKVLATIVTLAARCAQQGCTVDDLAAALTAALPAAAKDQLATAAAAVARLREVLAATSVTTARDQAAAVVAVIATAIELGHCSDDGCRTRVGWARDLALGAIAGDYLRALGAVSAGLRCKLGGRTRGALALLASVLSYVETYRATADADPKVAREERKRALLALIEAGTDRSGREHEWVVSLGVLVGFQAGYRDVHGTEDDSGRAYDLRLPLGVSALYLRDHDDDLTGFVNLAVADLANLAASSTEDLEPTLQWSDFVEVSAQAGFAIGRNTPLVIAGSIGWAPGLTYVDGAPTDAEIKTGGRGVFRLGVVVGALVPLFDL